MPLKCGIVFILVFGFIHDARHIRELLKVLLPQLLPLRHVLVVSNLELRCFKDESLARQYVFHGYPVLGQLGLPGLSFLPIIVAFLHIAQGLLPPGRIALTRADH